MSEFAEFSLYVFISVFINLFIWLAEANPPLSVEFCRIIYYWRAQASPPLSVEYDEFSLYLYIIIIGERSEHSCLLNYPNFGKIYIYHISLNIGPGVYFPPASFDLALKRGRRVNGAGVYNV